MNWLPSCLSISIHDADVRVIENRDRVRFALEATGRFRIPDELLRQELQRDTARHARIFRLVDEAHAAGPELADDAVVGQGGSDHGAWAPEYRRLAENLGRSEDTPAVRNRPAHR